MNEIKHIQKVEIANLFGRYDFEWTLQPDVNVLAGVNGSGKSTILSCLYALITFYRREIDSYTDNLNITFDNGDNLKYECKRFGGSIEDIEKQAENDAEVRSFLENLKNGNREHYNALVRVYEIHHRTFFNNLHLKDLKDFQSTALGSICVDSINTFDTELKDIESIRKLSNNNIRTELDWEIYNLQKRYLAYQLNLSKRKDHLVDTADNPKQAIKELRATHERFLSMLDVMMEETGKKVNREDNEISFLLDDGTPIYPYQLSSGEKQLLIILLTILVQDKKQAILFLDEPEISLHIEWQKKLIEYMTELNPNLQIILATHSPAIIMEGWFDKVFDMHDLLKPKK